MNLGVLNWDKVGMERGNWDKDIKTKPPWFHDSILPPHGESWGIGVALGMVNRGRSKWKPKDPYRAKDYVACLDTRPVPAFPCTHEGCTKEACWHREDFMHWDVLTAIYRCGLPGSSHPKSRQTTAFSFHRNVSAAFLHWEWNRYNRWKTHFAQIFPTYKHKKEQDRYFAPELSTSLVQKWFGCSPWRLDQNLHL